MAKSQPTVIAIGKNKGHKTTKIQAKRPRPVSTKAKLGKRTKLVRQIISQVAGVSGYEKRVIEYLKAGSLKDTKRALKATKKALGTHRRAKLKRENLMNLLRAQQAKKKWTINWSLRIFKCFAIFYPNFLNYLPSLVNILQFFVF